jgi:hypothetical protein
MKTFFCSILILTIFATQVNGQDTLRLFSKKPVQQETTRSQRSNDSNEIRTLTGNGYSNGFYMGLNSSYSQIYKQDAFNIGASVAWIANHSLALGFAGKGFFSEPQPYIQSTSKDFNYSGGYGGLLIEPILFPRMPIHISFPVILGIGGIARSIYYDLEYPYETTDSYIDVSDAFVLVEPGAELELNVARWIRIGLGCTYRFTQGIDEDDLPDNPLEGITTGFSIKLGKF